VEGHTRDGARAKILLGPTKPPRPDQRCTLAAVEGFWAARSRQIFRSSVIQENYVARE
jgi:hypothetical protein